MRRAEKLAKEYALSKSCLPSQIFILETCFLAGYRACEDDSKSYAHRVAYLRKYRREWVKKRRQKFLKGKRCAQCGSVAFLELDHIDPKNKADHKIWSWSEEKREQELKKCQVLCRKCHHHKTMLDQHGPRICGTIRCYKAGCRCDLCRKANAADKRRWRK